jgi:hypothetical protein
MMQPFRKELDSLLSAGKLKQYYVFFPDLFFFSYVLAYGPCGTGTQKVVM